MNLGKRIHLAGLLLLAAPCASTQTFCSTEMLRGVWAYRSEITIMMMPEGSPTAVPAPAAFLGIVSIDSAGKMTGSGDATVAGQPITAAFNGTLSVQANCSGSMRFTFTLPGAPAPMPNVGQGRFVVSDNGNEIRALTTSGILGAPIGIETYRRMSRNWRVNPGCSTAMIRGTYSFASQGVTLVPVQGQPMPVPTALLGLASIDSAGVVESKGVFTMGGESAPFETMDARISTRSDCTGEAEWALKGMGPSKGRDKIVVLDDGDLIWALTYQGIMGAPVAVSEYRRINRTAASVAW